jgi:acyl-CoA synthetase (AMP-forming)/AMP-acid ligase II
MRSFNLADLFELVADTVPDRLALVAGSVRLSYAELDARANRFAHHIIDSPTAPGAHVGILARNRAEWINLNYRYLAPELRYVVDNADLQVLVYERELSQLVADSWDVSATGPLHLIVVEDGTPTAEHDPVAAATGTVPIPYEEALAGSTA